MAIERAHESKALLALRQAVAKALDRKRRLGHYAVVWRDGRPVRWEPDALGRTGEYALAAPKSTTHVREPGSRGDGDGEPHT